ncbi:MAG: ABC transporter ATP-binding protein [Bryobacterales bacterium]
MKNVSLEVQNGECVGIIGRNGAGKSTLLKVLSRITLPTKGYAEIRGRVGSLLEVGTGFHPELTGRENIFLNGVILGMSRNEVRSKFDQIVEFAEVEKFIDTPVKRYSSGMYLRLAFSVAAHLEPEILLVDEVLAVGDARFQKRCLQKMDQVAKQGRTVLFVSHNMAAVRQLCTKAFLLGGGGVEATGSVSEVIRSYLRQSFDSASADLRQIADRKGKGEVRIAAVRFEDEEGNSMPGLTSGSPGRLVLTVESAKPHRRVQACVGVLDAHHQRVMYLNSYFVGDDIEELPQNGELVCKIPRVHLRRGVQPGALGEDRSDHAGPHFRCRHDGRDRGELPRDR